MTGRNPSTIHRAMKAGRLSYAKDAAGERPIEVAELERVFGLKPAGAGRLPVGNGAIPGNDAYASQGNDTHAGEQAALAQIQQLRGTKYSLREIASTLNEQGMRTRRGSAWRHEYVKRIVDAGLAARVQ